MTLIMESIEKAVYNMMLKCAKIQLQSPNDDASDKEYYINLISNLENEIRGIANEK